MARTVQLFGQGFCCSKQCKKARQEAVLYVVWRCLGTTPKGGWQEAQVAGSGKAAIFLPFIFFILLLLKKKLKRQQTSEMASLLDTLMLLSRLLGQCCIEFHYHHHVDVFVSSRNAYPLLLLLGRSVAWWDENGCIRDYMGTLSLLLSPFRVWKTNLKFALQNSPFVQFNAALIECHASLLSSCFCHAPTLVSWGGVLRDETRDECHARPPNGLWLNCFLRDVTRSLLCT